MYEGTQRSTKVQLWYWKETRSGTPRENTQAERPETTKGSKANARELKTWKVRGSTWGNACERCTVMRKQTHWRILNDCIRQFRKEKNMGRVSLHTAGATEIWTDQSGFSRRETLYCPDVNACTVTGKAEAMKSGNYSRWRWHYIFTKSAIRFKNQIRLQKVENMKHFVSKILIWLPKWVTANSLVVRQVSPGKILVVLFWKNMLFACSSSN